MKTHWEELWVQLERADEAFTTFLETGGLSTLSLKKSDKFHREWNAIKKLATAFDQYITPIDPLEVVPKYTSAEFSDMWTRWKEYLAEQHGQLMRTRAEQSALEHIADISKGNEQQAIRFLRYAMANRYKNFFAIEEKEYKQPPKGESPGTGSDF